MGTLFLTGSGCAAAQIELGSAGTRKEVLAISDGAASIGVGTADEVELGRKFAASRRVWTKRINPKVRWSYLRSEVIGKLRIAEAAPGWRPVQHSKTSPLAPIRRLATPAYASAALEPALSL